MSMTAEHINDDAFPGYLIYFDLIVISLHGKKISRYIFRSIDDMIRVKMK